MVVTQLGTVNETGASGVGSSVNSGVPSIQLNPTLSVLLEELVRTIAARNGENHEDARRLVELAIVSRGIAAVRAEVSE